MKNTSAIDFLLFSYFGFTLAECKEEKWDKIWKEDDEVNRGVSWKIINKAYKDATQQGAFNAIININSEELKELKKKGATIIRQGISELFNTKSSVDYDVWHKKICSNKESGGLVELYDNVKHSKHSEVNAFTYGNAQKWLNMTMKYLYIINQLCEEIYDENAYQNKEFADRFFVRIRAIKDIQDRLHVPVDSYIIQAVWEDENVRLPLTEKGQERRKRCKYSAEYVNAWSTWGNENKKYDDFQSDLSKKYASKIEWECKKWIEIARIRRGENPSKGE